MKLAINVVIVYVDGRLLVRTDVEGAPSNTVDVLADDSEEVESAIALALQSARRQATRMIVAVTR